MKTTETTPYTEWLANFMTALTAEKYAAQTVEFSAAMEATTGEGILDYTLSIKEQEKRIQQYDTQEGLSKEQQKVLIYYRTYKLLEQTDEDSEELQQPIVLQENDFECWLRLTNDLSAPLIRKQAFVIKMLREQNTDLFNCRNLAEVKTGAQAVLEGEDDRNIIRAIIRICAYAGTRLSAVVDNEEAQASAEANISSEQEYIRWCMMRGCSKNTVKQQYEYLDRVEAYVAEAYNCNIMANHTPEEAMSIMLRLYSDSYAHATLLSTQGERGYADLFSSYLLSKIDLSTFTLPPDPPRDIEKAPLLLTGDKRAVIAEYKNWVQEEWNRRGARISPGSIRTFASSLYACNSVLEEEFGEQEFDLFNPRSHTHAALLKHQITRAASFKADHGGALWSYIAFLSNRTIVNTEDRRLIRDKLARLLDEQTGGHLGSRLPAALPAMWQATYNEPMPQAPQLLEQITDELTIHCNGRRILPRCLLTAQEHARLEEYITTAFNSGCPVVDLEQILLFLNTTEEQHLTEKRLRRYLELTAHYLCDCDKSHIRRPGADKQTHREIAAYVCEVIRGFGRPVSPEEIRVALSYLSTSTIQTTFSRNELGWNIGLVNPKRKNVFHADIIKLTEEEVATITIIIYKHVEEHGYMSSGQLHQALSRCNLPFMAERDYLDIAALYSTIRYKLKNLFNFNSSFITLRRDEQDDGTAEVDVNTKSLFLDFCEKNRTFTIDELLGLASQLGKTTIPFADIYNTVARVSNSLFVHADELQFDIAATDATLSKHYKHPYTLLTEVMRDWKAPAVSGYEWTPHLMQYYLCFKSERYRLLMRAFAKQAAHNGFILTKEHELTTFEAAIASYLAAQTDLPLQDDAVLDFLLDRALIGVRRFKELPEILTAARKLRRDMAD